jgi:hypothetical protein
MRKKVTCHCEENQRFDEAIQRFGGYCELDCFALRARNDGGGFTLAVVLLYLGIIWVVAALTMPSFIQQQNERATVAKVKKIYSVMSNAFALWQVEEGCDTDVADCIRQYAAYDCKNAFSGVEKHLNIADRRYQDQSKADVDWLPDNVYGLDGSLVTVNWGGVGKVNGLDRAFCDFLLADGTIMAVQMPDTYKLSGFLYVDTNGPKPPNRVGKDVFPMGIGSNYSFSKGFNPYYTEDQSWNNYGLCFYRNGNECSPDDGKSPTAYVLAHDKLPDLKAIFGK